MSSPLVGYEVVRVGASGKVPFVKCKKCGEEVVRSKDMAAVRTDGAGSLVALPFQCLAHRCRK
jgi:hypothetical protein